ncbi:glycerophosphodiester phosphodiesterase family protein [Streptomyces sp. NPDC052052]|uniref:glycerophosphodiester phosphodiesterase n=1 Tax=Streptomyces sp. NPDC052052 TaxID=3154756 RepID=UPI00343E7C3B
MTTVTGKVIGGTPARTEVTCTLVDVTGERAVGYVADARAEIVRPVTVRPQSDGTWSAELVPNALVDSTAGDTVWAVMEGRSLDGTPVMTYILVPETPGPHWMGDLRVDLGDAPTGGSTIVYVPGPAGPAGPEGAQGPAGPTGATGPQPALGATGAGATIALKSTDPSTTNARTPTAHAASHRAGGSDVLTAADVGADQAGAATTAVSAHVTAADPHGDRAYADNKLAKASNLSDLASAATARTNLGLGSAATQPASAFDAAGAAAAAQTAAISAAATDASGKANSAQSAAISAAASDATTKADAARAAAVSTAAADATTKAGNAQTAAISTAAADATTKANNAQTAAVSAAATSAATLYLPNAIQTVDQYFAGATAADPRFFAHRGGGMVRPEHTLAAYRASAAQGFPLEVSVNVDASGELWCIHDMTMDRTTYRTGNVNTYTTEEIGQQVLTNGRVMLGPGWTDQPMVPLRQVLDEFLGRVIILLEAKGNDAVVPLENLLSTYYPHAPRSVVWKAHIGTASLPWAKAAGYRTWVYLDSGTTDATMDGKDSMVDYWGVQTTFTDTRIQQVVARGKPVFCWPVYRRSQVARLTGLGVVGIMASDPRYGYLGLSNGSVTDVATRPYWRNLVITQL